MGKTIYPVVGTPEFARWKGERHDYSPYEVKYSTSFDWLMPVVEKINTLDLSEFNYNVSKMTQMRLHQEKLQQFSITTPMRIVYPVVVEICKWYNENKSE